jgi:hypothetical protein
MFHNVYLRIQLESQLDVTKALGRAIAWVTVCHRLSVCACGAHANRGIQAPVHTVIWIDKNQVEIRRPSLGAKFQRLYGAFLSSSNTQVAPRSL